MKILLKKIKLSVKNEKCFLKTNNVLEYMCEFLKIDSYCVIVVSGKKS